MLKLKALDTDDLQVVSAMMQDALARVGDMSYDAKRRKFAIVSNRFAWDSKAANERRRAGLHFDHVLKAARKGFQQSAPDTILSLLSITFIESKAPSGKIQLTFSAGHSILLDVEYIDCSLRDLGPVWGTENKPKHEA